MEIYVAKSTYNTSGGSCLYGYAGDLLTAHIDDYGTAINEIEVVACLPSKSRKFRPTLEALFDQFHAYIDSLPRITFQRKNKRVKIEFRSEHFTADDEESRNATPEQQMAAAHEVAQALSMLRKRIKPSDDFDVERFLQDASKILATKIENPGQGERVRQAAVAKRIAIRDAKSPWERLEIAWERFHPKARDILDEPYYWECADDLAPNGNDTGADLLEDFRRWNKKHPRTSPIKFLDGLMKAWGIDPIDWHITDRASVTQLAADQPIPLKVCNEAEIALAFAVIKVRANCPTDVAERGLAAITRTEDLVKRSRLDKTVRNRWKVSLAKLRNKLATFTP